VTPLPCSSVPVCPIPPPCPLQQSLESYSPFTSYALSKLCNTMMAAEYQRRFDRHDACTYGHDSAVAIHPGIVATSLATGFFTQVWWCWGAWPGAVLAFAGAALHWVCFSYYGPDGVLWLGSVLQGCPADSKTVGRLCTVTQYASKQHVM
jgi:hypothetical protein